MKNSNIVSKLFAVWRFIYIKIKKADFFLIPMIVFC